MWKLLVAFILFAAVGLFVLKKAGGDIDMGGEKHGIETSSHADPAASAASAASAAPAPAASASAAVAASAGSN
jgi:hypothetical protein